MVLVSKGNLYTSIPICMKKLEVNGDIRNAQRELRSACAVTQADLSLRWAHMSKDIISHDALISFQLLQWEIPGVEEVWAEPMVAEVVAGAVVGAPQLRVALVALVAPVALDVVPSVRTQNNTQRIFHWAVDSTHWAVDSTQKSITVTTSVDLITLKLNRSKSKNRNVFKSAVILSH